MWHINSQRISETLIEYLPNFRCFPKLHKISLVAFWMSRLMYKERIKVILRQADPYDKTGNATKGSRGCKRTSDGSIGNHSVLLPIIWIKNIVDQMIPSSYISSCWSQFNDFASDFLFPWMYGFILVLKWSLLLYTYRKQKTIFKTSSPRAPTNPFARKCVLIFYIICVKS